MSPVIQLGSVQLLPVKDATEFVPYSRDYVARLAREGKVVATQIDRQWFVDVTSLQNFFTHATIEESVRKRHLSVVRKRDLEVREVYRARLTVIAKKRKVATRASVVQTSLVLLCGLCAGYVFISVSHSRAPEYVLVFAKQILAVSSGQPSTAAVVQSARVPNPFSAEAQRVIETDSSFDVSKGIVVLPSASSSSSTIEDFFSDPVTVDMNSPMGGSIRNTVSNKAIPFVRVPTSAVVVPNKTSDGNEVIP